MSAKEGCIVTIDFPGFTHATVISIYYPNGHRGGKFLPIADFYKDPNKCSDFFGQLTSLVPAEFIKGLALIALVNFPINVIQKVNKNFRNFCESHGIFYYSPSAHLISSYAMLSNIKPNIEKGECVAVVNAIHDISVQILKRTGKEFEFMERFGFLLNDLSEFKKTVSSKYNLKQLLFIKRSADNNMMPNVPDTSGDVIKVFPELRVAHNTENLFFMENDAAANMVRRLMGEKMPTSIFMVKPFFDRDIEFSSSLIECKHGQLLPFEKSVTRKVGNDCVITLHEKPFGGIEHFILNHIETKDVKITLKVDTNMIYDVKVEPVADIPKVEPVADTPKLKAETLEFDFEKNLKIKDTSTKAKIIFGQNHFSIHVMEDGKDDKVIKDSDGSSEIPLYVSFMEKKPAVGEAAVKIFKKHPTFVVYDLMKFCSKDFDGEKADPKWPFKLPKNSKNEMFIEFETSDGPRKTQSDFLMAIIFSFCLKLIEKETGEKLEEVEIEFDENLGEKENFVPCFAKAAEKVNLKLVFV